MIHYLYIGHFVPEGDSIKVAGDPANRAVVPRPVIQHPIDPEKVRLVLQKMGLASATDIPTPVPEFPPGWQVRFSKDQSCVIVNMYSRQKEVVDFVRELAASTGALLLDYAEQRIRSPYEYARWWEDRMSYRQLPAKS